MNTPNAIPKLAAALLKAQKEIGAAKKGAINPFFHSKYADLGSVMEACKDALNNNGITVLQPVGHDEQGDYVETILLHESGEYISDKMRLLSCNKPQEQGSAISYARRYSLQSLVFIPSEDDDANTAQEMYAKDDDGTIHISESEDLGACSKCGSPNALSKAGNRYCSNKCWMKQT